MRNKKKGNTRQKHGQYFVGHRQATIIDTMAMDASTAAARDTSFARNLENFVTLDDEIKKKSEEAKKLRNNKAALEESISTHMLDHELDEGTVDGSTVRMVKKKKVTNAFTRSNVQQCALALFGAEGADSLLRKIDDLKETTESHGIKRIRTN